MRCAAVLIVLVSLFASGCLVRGYGDGSIGRSRYGVVPGYAASTTTTTTTVYASPYATGPTTITYGSYPAYGGYGYGYGYGGTTYVDAPVTAPSAPTGTVYPGYDSSGYGYGVTSAYGAPAGYGSATVVVPPR